MSKYIPYGRQIIDDHDIKSVCEVLKSDWLTTGPKVEEFEKVISQMCDTKYAVAVSSGTAALHSTMAALDITIGDEVILPTMTFAATANSIVYQGGIPVFADINKDNLLINLESVKEKINKKTKAIIAVDYAGHPADYVKLKNLAKEHNLSLISDSCHSLGGKFMNKTVSSITDLSTYSFHPVKHITTGEGGAITTNNEKYYLKMKNFRNHGITSDHRERAKNGAWFYEMEDLGYNYRISDFQCALGISQLEKLSEWIKRRQEIAMMYSKAFNRNDLIKPLAVNDNVSHAYHLYVVRIDFSKLNIDRTNLFMFLKKNNIGVNVHYIPVHLHPFYRKNFKTNKGDCPIAEFAYEQIVSLPIYPAMEDASVLKVIKVLKDIMNKNAK